MDSHHPTRQTAGTDLVYAIPKILCPVHDDGRTSDDPWFLKQCMLQHPTLSAPSLTWGRCIGNNLTHLYCAFLFSRCKINDCYLLMG